MGPPMKLLDDSSDEEPENEFTINKNYAERYDIWRNKEELQKLKDLSKEISSSSSESEEEEEPEIEKDFLKTLSLLKSKDPRIYDESTEFFKEEATPKKPKAKKEKPMFMKDYERKIVLEQNGMFVDEEDDDDNNKELPERQLLTNKEEEEIKKSFIEAAPDSDEEDELFQVRTKTKVEEEKEEADYKQWLETEKDLLFLNKCWNDPKIDEDEKFLRDYILNKRYLTDDKPGEIPMYDEITQDIDLLNEDEKDLEKQEIFEHKYNFRFEEPDEEFIKSYPRTIGDSLRRENNKRKQKREEYTERKKKEKEQKREELKRLKALKRKEIEEKFLKLKEASGQDQLNLDESDIESDFDPDKHDQKMREMFNEDYYNVEEEQKPEFEYDEEIDDENWDRWTRDQKNYSQNAMNEEEENDGESYSEEEEENNSKKDLRSQFEQEMIDSTSNNKKRKGRKKSLFAKILSQPKPLYDPNGKSFDEYLDEYYKLDYEDIVGDMPVRFKYRKVVPNDFGLTIDEILAAQDKELNRWCSVKKTCQYRDDKDEIYDVQAFKKKAQNFETKKKILASVYTPPEEEKISQTNTDNSNEAARKPKKKRKRSKKKKAIENSDNLEENTNSEQNANLSTENTGTNGYPESSIEVSDQAKRKKKKKKSLTNLPEAIPRPDLRENENGFSEEDMQQNASGQEHNDEDIEAETNQNSVKNVKKKKKNKMKTLEDTESVPNIESFIESDAMNESNIKGNKKKKRKKSQFLEEDASTTENYDEFEMSENVISKKKKRKFESLENEQSSSFAENDDDETETDNHQDVVKKRKLDSVEETDLLSVKKPNKSSVKKPKSVNSIRTNFSLTQQNAAKSIYGENSVEIDTNRKKKKRKNNQQQSFGSKPPQKRNFYSQKFQYNQKQNDTNSIQIVDNSGKKIVSSNTRLSAFEINPKKFKNKLIYGKNQT
ncbi:protein KRI1 homolog [Argiope bruennichi]|uniref:Protein KRI1 homolog n=1 Tax=Argiope bruennichi TaxID=94029 RepID=A0A8T0FV02_ARGBR|nr:protein KRI1 homolog [Argiope bruennichi]KAF8792593.1 Protein KRI1 like protein [Argiope bruennichi]